jgi:hypothetical protein
MVGVTEIGSAAVSNDGLQPTAIGDEQGSFLTHGREERSVTLG